MRTLVVEDDCEIAEGVRTILLAEGHFADVAPDGDSALRFASVCEYGLVILDVLVPGQDGWQILERLRRSRFNSPVLMVSALDSVDDRIKGLEHGADDYLTKPFDPRELVARVRALLRREKALKTGKLEVADLVIDTSTKSATRAGEPLKLTPREYTLLEALAANVGRVMTREVILGSVFSADTNTENSISFHIASLRRKVDGRRPSPLIQTVHGFGYRLVSDDQ